MEQEGNESPKANSEQEYVEPEHPEFDDLNNRASEDPNRNPDGTFKDGHNCGFQKGQSGNPNGRPKTGEQPVGHEPAPTTVTACIRHLMKKPCTVRGYKKMTWAQALSKAMLTHALEKANAQLCNSILDRAEGTVKQIHEIDATSKTILKFSVAEAPDKKQHEENLNNGNLNGTTKAKEE